MVILSGVLAMFAACEHDVSASEADAEAPAKEISGGRGRMERAERARRKGSRGKRAERPKRAPAQPSDEPQARIHLPALDGAPARPWLVEVSEAWGLDFKHVAGDTREHHLPQITGNGSALFDYDGDGDLDLYLLHGAPDPSRPTERGGLSNQLFRNALGRAFEEVPGAAGLRGAAYGQGVAVGDIDNDGFDDVFLSNWGPDQLYGNTAGESFHELVAAGVAGERDMSASAVFFDYDRDGWLDLFVTRYVKYVPGKRCFDFADRQDYCGPSAFDPLPDALYRNTGEGTFADVSLRSGIGQRAAPGLGVVTFDYDDDGWPDLYVVNDGYENHLWINGQKGSFVDDAVMVGVAFNQSGMAEAGMGVVAGDFDLDGNVDLYVTHLAKETNTLYRALDAGRGFLDWTGPSGLASTSIALTGFGTTTFDVELDGDLDLFVVNGRVKRDRPYAGVDLGSHWNDYAEPNLFYLNRGDGRFDSGRNHALAYCDALEVGRSIVVGDLDGDADYDLCVTNLDGRARLYLNQAPRVGHSLLVEAFEPSLRRDAIGARVALVVGERRQTRTVQRSQGYLVSNDPRVHFGAQGSGAELEQAALYVRWPDGVEERFEVSGWDRCLRLVRGDGEDVP